MARRHCTWSCDKRRLIYGKGRVIEKRFIYIYLTSSLKAAGTWCAVVSFLFVVHECRSLEIPT